MKLTLSAVVVGPEDGVVVVVVTYGSVDLTRIFASLLLMAVIRGLERMFVLPTVSKPRSAPCNRRWRRSQYFNLPLLSVEVRHTSKLLARSQAMKIPDDSYFPVDAHLMFVVKGVIWMILASIRTCLSFSSKASMILRIFRQSLRRVRDNNFVGAFANFLLPMAGVSTSLTLLEISLGLRVSQIEHLSGWGRRSS